MKTGMLFLLDLDNTLLANDMERFIPIYLRKLAAVLPDWPPEMISKHILAGTMKMVENLNPAKTLEETFDLYFYPALGTSKEKLLVPLTNFYAQIFPQLASSTNAIPKVPEIVDLLFRQGQKLIIATKPVFPKAAVFHRLRWAGLENQVNNFSLITSYEDFHFSKPSLEYFAEVFAQLGWPDLIPVMVGDSLEDDLVPASKIGIPSYHLFHGKSSQNRVNAEFKTITIDDLPKLAATSERFNWENTFQGISGILAVLRSTAAGVDTIMRKVQAKKITLLEPSDEWTLTEILAHLRDADLEVNLPRIERICRGENPFLPGVVTDDWAAERNYRKEDLVSAFNGFMAARLQLLALLTGLAIEDWEKPARHAIFGPTRLIELAGFVATHDKNHIQQASLLCKPQKN
jgi:FMN phosphatase YigB (HAD superfamily)